MSTTVSPLLQTPAPSFPHTPRTRPHDAKRARRQRDGADAPPRSLLLDSEEVAYGTHQNGNRCQTLLAVERAGAGQLKLAEMAALFWHCLADRDGLTREQLGETVATLESMVADGYVPENLASAVVKPEWFQVGYPLLELPPAVRKSTAHRAEALLSKQLVTLRDQLRAKNEEDFAKALDEVGLVAADLGLGQPQWGGIFATLLLEYCTQPGCHDPNHALVQAGLEFGRRVPLPRKRRT